VRDGICNSHFAKKPAPKTMCLNAMGD